MAGKVKLPTITHPSRRGLLSDVKQLKLTGNNVFTNKNSKMNKAIVPANRTKNPRPFSVPAITHLRPQSTADKLSVDELIDLINDKLRGNGYFVLKNTFNAFDPDRRFTVTRDALYRILCNTLGGITLPQFNQLLNRLKFGSRRIVSFDDFYSRFHAVPAKQLHWLDKMTSHGRRSITAEYVHSVLLARAKKCESNLSEYLPGWKGLDGRLDSVEFRNILNSLCFPLNDDQYHILWTKYDSSGKGYITGKQLLNKLGVQLKDKSDSSISNNEQTTSNEKPEEVILPVISDKVNSLMTAFVKKDTSNLGKINSVQVKDSLCEVGIPITQMQCDNMLSRLGFSPEKVVEYQSLILALSNKSTGGLAHAVLSDATQRYYVGSKRASRSTPDAEVNVICSLHKEFLKLVSQLRSHDTKKNGLISKDAFQEVIKEYLPSNSHEILESLTDKVLDKETGLVIYPKFLSFFDGPPVTKQKNDHDDTQNNMDESSMKDFKQLDAELMKLCLNNPEMVIEAFEVIDPNNTCRITKNMLQQILFRLGFDPNMEVVGGLWDKLLKTKDGCIHPHEFIRHYTKPHPHQPEVGRMVMTDNHVPLKSKFLHRDADIIMRNLKGMLSLYQKSIIGYFRYKDPQGTGLISSDIFQKLLVSLCPQLNNQELAHLTEMFKDEAEPNMVNYVTLMKGVTRPQPVYKVGNDLSTLLAHFPAPTVSLPQVHLPVSTPPQYGLPGVKVKLQRKLMQRWNEFKRNLSKLDPLNTGLVSIKDFHAILSDYGVTLSREDSYHILQELDPLLSGSVNYLMFFQLLMGQQQ